MNNYYDENDPIQEFGKRRIKIEKYNENESKVSNKKSSAAKSLMTTFIMLWVFFFGVCIFLIWILSVSLDFDTQIKSDTKSYDEIENYKYETNEEIKNEVEEDTNVFNEKHWYNGINLAELEVIIFKNGAGIPTLYLIDKSIQVNWCEFIKLDPRFNKSANTIEINYEYIPEESLNALRTELLDGEFSYLGNEKNGELYLLDTNDEYFVFAILSDTNIIYGGGIGEYRDVFDFVY